MTDGSAPGVSTGAIAFSDIVGFTEMTADHGDDLAMALVDRHEALVLGVLGQHGRIVKQLGDGLLLFFSDPCEAVDAMLRVHDGTSRLSLDGVPFRLRTGLHFGSPAPAAGISSDMTSTSHRVSQRWPDRESFSPAKRSSTRSVTGVPSSPGSGRYS